MIAFKCPSCGRSFGVPDHYAGREARCACKQVLIVPQPTAAAAAAPSSQGTPSAPTSLRARRLAADERELRERFGPAAGGVARIVEAHGSPPERYVVEFDVATLVRPVRGDPQPVRGGHRAEVELTNDYPRVGPRCRMLTPAFHPNIDAAGICVGDHWTAGERLGDLVLRIAEMLAYQAYNVRSPLDAEAAMWADLNRDRLPVDPRDLRASS